MASNSFLGIEGGEVIIPVRRVAHLQCARFCTDMSSFYFLELTDEAEPNKSSCHFWVVLFVTERKDTCL